MNDRESALVAMIRENGNSWALHPKYWSGLLGRKAGDLDAQAAKLGAVPRVNGAVAVIPVEGPTTRRGGWFSVSTERIGRAFDAAIANDQIKGVVFDLDTPGGSVTGTPELSDKIYEARGTKPIISVATGMAASAGYYYGSASDSFIASPSAEVGSIGVWMMHVDESKFWEEIGVNVTLISAGKYKVEGHPFAPLDEAASDHYQSIVDKDYADFLKAVARNRGASVAEVKANYGEGRVLSATDALAAKMIDGIRTLDQVLSKMGATGGSAKTRAEDEDLTAWLLDASEVKDDKEPSGISTAEYRIRQRQKERSNATTAEK